MTGPRHTALASARVCSPSHVEARCNRLKRIAVTVAVTVLAVAMGGVAAAGPAEATEPIPGMPGCYMFNFYDYMYLFHGVSGYCPGDPGPIYFDDQGNYW